MSIKTDKPPDGQWECEPYWDCVNHDAEVRVKEQKYCPGKRKLKEKLLIKSKNLEFYIKVITAQKYWWFWKFDKVLKIISKDT